LYGAHYTLAFGTIMTVTGEVWKHIF